MPKKKKMTLPTESRPLLLSFQGAREMLGIDSVSRSRLYGWLRSGILPNVKSGSRFYIARTSVEALVERIARGEWPSEDDA